MKFKTNQFILLIVISLLSWLNMSQIIGRSHPISVVERQSLEEKVAQALPETGKYRDKFCFLTVPELTDKLLADLPDYANRVIQRTQDSHREAGIDTYVIDAGRGEFKPLPLPQFESSSNSSQGVSQVFFTIRERQYYRNRKLERETYYWLFLIPTTQGWQMMMLFSRFGDGTKNNPPTPPQETSQGIIGQAVNLWLKDCSAGSIRTR